MPYDLSLSHAFQSCLTPFSTFPTFLSWSTRGRDEGAGRWNGKAEQAGRSRAGRAGRRRRWATTAVPGHVSRHGRRRSQDGMAPDGPGASSAAALSSPRRPASWSPIGPPRSRRPTRYVVVTRQVEAGYARCAAEDLGTVAAELPDGVSAVPAEQADQIDRSGRPGPARADGPAPTTATCSSRGRFAPPAATEVALDLPPPQALLGTLRVGDRRGRAVDRPGRSGHRGDRRGRGRQRGRRRPDGRGHRVGRRPCGCGSAFPTRVAASVAGRCRGAHRAHAGAPLPRPPGGRRTPGVHRERRGAVRPDRGRTAAGTVDRPISHDGPPAAQRPSSSSSA